jgi:Leucine rich repeat
MKTVLVLCVLFSAVTALHMECSYFADTMYSQFGRAYGCYVSKVMYTHDPILSLARGSHQRGKSNRDVKEIIFGVNGADSCMDSIPQNILSFYRNINGLGFGMNCQIKKLTGDELKAYSNLEWFALWMNQIEEIPSNLFDNNPKLKLVDFKSNKIARIGLDLFAGLNDLTSIDFRNNICISDRADQSRVAVIALVQKLKELCSQPENQTGTCEIGNFAERICKLEGENRELKSENENLKSKYDDIVERLIKLEAKFTY